MAEDGMTLPAQGAYILHNRWLFALIQKIEWSVWKSSHPSLAYKIVIVPEVGLFNLSLIRDKEMGGKIFYIYLHPYSISVSQQF